MTSLVLRVDAGPGIGVGHLSRCVAFAEEAVARGWTATVAGDLTGADWLAARLAELAVEVRPDLCAADIVLVDHYGLLDLRGVPLVSMEDGVHGRRRADVVVDCGLAPPPRPDDGSGLVLLGPAYAPLRTAVRAARRPRPVRDRPRVVVAMGGGAMADAVASALAALWATGLPMDVLAVSAAPVDAGTPGEGVTVEVTGPRTDLPDLFADADLVVSAAGVTLLELCCLGVPTALVALADNQVPGYTAATERGLAAGLGDLTDAAATLRHLLTDRAAREAMATAAATVVDGLGARRVLDAATNAMRSAVTDGVGLVARPATMADADRLLAWRNDPVTRRWSVHPDPVPRETHESWLTAALTTRRLVIVEEAGVPVGVVRFDPVAAGEVEVSITIAPHARRRGLARPVLETAQAGLAGVRALARVLPDNEVSRRLFESAGYRRVDRPAENGCDFYARDL